MKLVAVGECTFAPFEYVDEAYGQPLRFDVDLIHAMAEAGLKLSTEYDWNSLIAALQTGRRTLWLWDDHYDEVSRSSSQTHILSQARRGA